jgi:hypothetical protein
LLNLDPGVNPPGSGPGISDCRNDGRTEIITVVVECFVCPLSDQYGGLLYNGDGLPGAVVPVELSEYPHPFDPSLGDLQVG